MHEILRGLRPGARVLDLGCNSGSFAESATAAQVIRVDRDRGQSPSRYFVQADAAHLPFADGSLAAIVSNHSLEHFDNLAGALDEIGRVIARDGALFVAVPDASTLTDKLYRWLASGGGHVNAFTSPRDLAAKIESATGLHHIATRTLYSSLSFLNRRNSPRPIPRRLWLIGAGYEWSLFLYSWFSRRLDRRLNTRTAIYGWAFYFGQIHASIDTEAWPNVCIRCGSGVSAGPSSGQLRALRTWRCPQCGALNPWHGTGS